MRICRTTPAATPVCLWTLLLFRIMTLETETLHTEMDHSWTKCVKWFWNPAIPLQSRFVLQPVYCCDSQQIKVPSSRESQVFHDVEKALYERLCHRWRVIYHYTPRYHWRLWEVWVHLSLLQRTRLQETCIYICWYLYWCLPNEWPSTCKKKACFSLVSPKKPKVFWSFCPWRVFNPFWEAASPVLSNWNLCKSTLNLQHNEVHVQLSALNLKSHGN